MFDRKLLACIVSITGIACSSDVQSAQCMEVTLTGTQGGPPVFQGQAGPGTLVSFGEVENNCRDILLQFDTGRGTTQSLSKLGVAPGAIDAIFYTHMHSDHVEGLLDLAQFRWHFNSAGPKADVVCHEDIKSAAGHTISCINYTNHIGDAFIESGELAQRISENTQRKAGGPSDMLNVVTFKPSQTPVVVWEKGGVTVSKITSQHIPGHTAYRVDTAAGSVVIGGDAGNDKQMPPRETSTSAQVETLAKDADIIVHSVIHPLMGPEGETGFPPPTYYRQSQATDLGSMSKRAGAANLMLTHLIPPIGAARQGPFPVPNGGLTKEDYEDAVRAGGFEGNVVVGTDLVKLRLETE